MDARAQAYLQAMGIQRWQRRLPQAASVAVPAAPAEPKPVGQSPVTIPVADAPPDWSRLRQTVADCTACELHCSRKQTVFGVGDIAANWMIIGEAPGADEDAQGEPFVGRAGQLLNAMLLAVGLPREQVYIANILKCRPPNNRDPSPEEVASCIGFLRRQIEMVSPKIILVVGRIAAHSLLQTEEAIGRLRGRVHRLADFDIPLVVTYHPAYLLRKPVDKAKAWQDLQLARRASRGMPAA